MALSNFGWQNKSGKTYNTFYVTIIYFPWENTFLTFTTFNGVLFRERERGGGTRERQRERQSLWGICVGYFWNGNEINLKDFQYHYQIWSFWKNRYLYINHHTCKLIKKNPITILMIFCLQSNFKYSKLLKTKYGRVSFLMALDGFTNGYLKETLSSSFSIKSNLIINLSKLCLVLDKTLKQFKWSIYAVLMNIINAALLPSYLHLSEEHLWWCNLLVCI